MRIEMKLLTMTMMRIQHFEEQLNIITKNIIIVLLLQSIRDLASELFLGLRITKIFEIVIATLTLVVTVALAFPLVFDFTIVTF